MSAIVCPNCRSPLPAGARFCSHCGAPAEHAQPQRRDAQGALVRGTILEERYKIMTFIGKGGFSRVYGAIDLRLRVPCAIKENKELDRDAHEQFIAEAQLLGRLKHPNLAKVTDYFTDDEDNQYLVMEYIPGKDLEALMSEESGPLPWRQVAEWGLIMCEVLEYLHTQAPPIIHRDIKPANIRLMPDDTLMLFDLGIAKVQRPGSGTARAAKAYSGGYSSLEQYLGQSTDARSDLYSLGATLYNLLTDSVPPEAVERMRGVPLQPLEHARPDIPPLMARAIDRALAMDPALRPPSAQAMALVFERVLAGESTPTQPAIGVTIRAEPARPVAQPPIGVRPPSAPVPTPTPRVPTAPKSGKVVLWPGDQREMVVVPGGPFVIGSDDFDGDEAPAHSLTLPAFLIDRFPVTCAEYSRFVADADYPPPPYWAGATPPIAIEDHPVVEVTLDDALAYASWANKRLPTEAEWEKAACWDTKANRAYLYPWGDDWDADRANTRDGGAGGTVPVGAYTPQGDSPCGAGEMLGNIWEWTASAYRKYPYDPHDGREDQETSGLRVTRGVSWSCSHDVVRACNRNVCAASDADPELGFRCAADLPR